MDAVNQFVKFINENYELYGRKIVIKRIVGDCPTTPPDYDKCNAAAQQVVKEKPFAVIWATSLYATVFDIWAQAGIPSFGGSTFDVSFYNRNRPFRYDLFMDGTKAADHIAEYYCKKMAEEDRPTTPAPIIHPTIGGRDHAGATSAIIVPEIEANVLTGQAGAGQGRRRATAAIPPRCCAPTSPTSRRPPSRRRPPCRRSSPARSRRSCACATRSRRCSSPRA